MPDCKRCKDTGTYHARLCNDGALVKVFCDCPVGKQRETETANWREAWFCGWLWLCRSCGRSNFG